MNQQHMAQMNKINEERERERNAEVDRAKQQQNKAMIAKAYMDFQNQNNSIKMGLEKKEQ